jgi:hypothetical protein
MIPQKALKDRQPRGGVNPSPLSTAPTIGKAANKLAQAIDNLMIIAKEKIVI